MDFEPPFIAQKRLKENLDLDRRLRGLRTLGHVPLLAVGVPQVSQPCAGHPKPRDLNKLRAIFSPVPQLMKKTSRRRLSRWCPACVPALGGTA